jgi:outer membrane protein OmpA-like peptidoglycan-associated protein
MIRMISFRPLASLSAGLIFCAAAPSNAEQPDVSNLQEDRERLIDLVLNLESNFSVMIKDYRALQKDYSKLVEQPVALDQEDEVTMLRRKLTGAITQIGNLKQLEEGPRKSSEVEIAKLKKTLHGDLAALRKELGVERNALKIASAQLDEFRRIQIETGRVEEMLRTETVGRADLLADVQLLRGERDALLAHLKGNMELLEKSENERKKAEIRVAELETSNDGLESDLKKRSAEIADLTKKAATSERLQMTITRLEGEKKLAMETLNKNKAELVRLKADPAGKTKMLASMDQLKKDLGASKGLLVVRDAEVKKLSVTAAQLVQEKTALTGKLQLGAKQLKEAQVALAAKEKEAALAAKLAADLKKARSDFAMQQKAVADAAILKKEKETLAATLAARGAEDKKFRIETAKRLEEIFTKNEAKLTRLATEQREKSKATTLKIALLEKDKTKLQNDLAKRETELRNTRAQAVDQAKVTTVIAKIEEEKEDLVAKLASREADLKKVRMDLGKLHLKSEATEKHMHALKIRIATVNSVRYALGIANVRDQQQRVLNDMKEVLAMFPSARFEIVGHTCDLGSKEDNLKLSQNRAGSLSTYLCENGIDPDLLKSRGMADAEPLVPNTNEENRRRNRRVEIHILD